MEENKANSNNNNKQKLRPSLKVATDVIIAQHKLPKMRQEHQIDEKEELKNKIPKRKSPIKLIEIKDEEKPQDLLPNNNINNANTTPIMNKFINNNNKTVLTNKKPLSKSVDDFPSSLPQKLNQKRNSVVERERIKINLISTINHSFSKNLTTEINN